MPARVTMDVTRPPASSTRGAHFDTARHSGFDIERLDFESLTELGAGYGLAAPDESSLDRCEASAQTMAS